MITYLPNQHPEGSYVISYLSLREDFRRYSAMTDDEFGGSLIQVPHFACITCWFKETQTQQVLSDTGVIHELVHLLEGFYQGNDEQFHEVRKLFNQECRLV